MSDKTTKNQESWLELFDKYNILNEVNKSGLFEIDAKQINCYREARLMTKFDQKINLPKIFLDNDLSILPITRGKYIISNFDTYHNFEDYNKDINYVKFPDNIESIDYSDITSESTAINCAFISGMLNDFIERDELFPTVSGRMSSRDFSFDIMHKKLHRNINISVSKSQIEIDGGYESIDSLSLIEAKNVLSKDFLIRQIYYPFRLWSNIISKEIKPIFMVYTNDIFNFYEYKFEDLNNYNSLTLLRHKRYCLDDRVISIDDITEVFNNISCIDDINIPFPQANNFERIINLCELLKTESKTKDEIASQYSFDIRQSDYYTNAGKYLGLISKDRDSGKYSLSQKGIDIFKKKHKEKQLALVKEIISHKAFYKTLKNTLDTGILSDQKNIVDIMKSSNLFNINRESTYNRRSSTIKGWIDWVLSLINK